jgi:hypothetical protein
LVVFFQGRRTIKGAGLFPVHVPNFFQTLERLAIEYFPSANIGTHVLPGASWPVKCLLSLAVPSPAMYNMNGGPNKGTTFYFLALHNWAEEQEIA